MKKSDCAAEVRGIEMDSWALLHFDELPKDATSKQLVVALEADQDWQENHMNEVSRRIDALVAKIEEEA